MSTSMTSPPSPRTETVTSTDAAERPASPLPTAFDKAGIKSEKINRNWKENYEPNTNWFQCHRFYGESSSDPSFFSAAAAQVRRNNPDLQELDAMYGKRDCNLSVIHAGLFRKVTETGMLSVDDFLSFVQSLVIPTTSISFVTTWLAQVGVPNDKNQLPYQGIMSAVEVLFNQEGTEGGRTARACFDLCDLTRTGYILKPLMKQLRVQDDPTIPLELIIPEIDDEVNKQEVVDHLSYFVIRAIMRGFEKIAEIEEENIRAAFMKGKKRKKAANVPMPSQRQFHINFKEFTTLLQTDPFLVSAFLPYALMKASENSE